MALSAGDIAFLRMQTDNPDSFSFVTTKTINQGEIIYFTDNGWTSTGGFNNSEGVISFTTPAGGLATGRVVTWTSGETNNFFNVNFSNTFNLQTDGDQIIAFQASDSSSVTAILATVTSLIAAVNTDANNWDTVASTNTSALPGSGTSALALALTDLTEGLYSVSVGQGPRIGQTNSGSNGENDNAQYSIATNTSTTRADLLASVNNRVNWTGSLDAIQTAPNYTFALCYLTGSHIQTPAGERLIETLAIGDEITTIDGTQRIRWIGRHSYTLDVAGPWVTPIRIQAHAFGRDMPHRDLLVSPWHAILFGDVMVRAADLVNGSTITQEFPGVIAHYLNIEFEAPTVIYAEGVGAESYANHGNRHMFENVAEYTALYGDDDRLMADAKGHFIRRFSMVFDGAKHQAALRRASREQRAA